MQGQCPPAESPCGTGVSEWVCDSGRWRGTCPSIVRQTTKYYRSPRAVSTALTWHGALDHKKGSCAVAAVKPSSARRGDRRPANAGVLACSRYARLHEADPRGEHGRDGTSARGIPHRLRYTDWERTGVAIVNHPTYVALPVHRVESHQAASATLSGHLPPRHRRRGCGQVG